MKKTIISAATLLFALTSCAQKAKQEIPQTVKTGLEKQYPEAKEVSWEKEGANYEAAFEQQETEISVLLDASGKILETEIEIHVAELPQSILDYVATNFKGQKIKEAAKITYPDGKIHFEAEVKGSDLIFDANGVFIKEIKQ